MPRSTHGAPLPPDCVWDNQYRGGRMIKHKFLKQVEGYPTPLMAKTPKAMWNKLLERGHKTQEEYAAAVTPRQSHSPARPRPAFQQPSPQGVLALPSSSEEEDDDPDESGGDDVATEGSVPVDDELAPAEEEDETADETADDDNAADPYASDDAGASHAIVP